MLTIGLLTWVGQDTHMLWVLGSFGASAVLVFGFPHMPFAQPRNIIGGYLLSVLLGLAGFHFLGDNLPALAFTSATAIALMMLTGTVHPPAGSTPILIYLLQPDGQLLVLAALGGSAVMVLAAVLYHRASKRHEYPVYW
jgi:CBS-domain-containing membrane protein